MFNINLLNINLFNVNMLNLKSLGVALLVVSLCGCAAPGAQADGHAFFKSAQLDDARTMRTLLAAGVDPNQTEPQRGDTGMILALREDANKVIALLLEQPKLNLEATSGNGDTALMMAAYKHNMPTVVALLKKGAQVNRPGWSALHYAAASGDEAIARLLLEHHADIDAASPTKVTPLMIAAREGQQGAARLLLGAGADASLTSSDGISALQFAQNADKPIIAAAIAAHLKAANLRRPRP